MSDENSLPTIRRQRLGAWMQDQQMSRTELAVKLGVGRAYTSLLFNPERSFGAVAARTIEKALFLPTHYLDERGTASPLVADWEQPSTLPDDVYALVPQIEVSLSAGDGADAGVEQELPPLAFRRSWLQGKQVTSRGNLRVASVRGDSMQPYLFDGDTVLIDLNQRDIQEQQCYAIRYGDEIRVKRLSQRFDGGLKIRSDNSIYTDEVLSESEAKSVSVIGRVLWRCG